MDNSPEGGTGDGAGAGDASATNKLEENMVVRKQESFGTGLLPQLCLSLLHMRPFLGASQISLCFAFEAALLIFSFRRTRGLLGVLDHT
jgi:hypothetical protein